MRWARWLAPVVALGIAGAVITLAVSSGGGAAEPQAPRAAVSAEALLQPHVALFGAAVRAELRITVDRRRVDPRTVHATARLAPFSSLGPIRIRRQASGPVTLIRIRYRLHCVAAACSRPGGQASVPLRPAVVRWGSHRLAVEWPPEAIASRLTVGDFAHPSLRYAADAPGPAYRFDPVVVGWTSIGAAAALVLALGVFVPLKVRRVDVEVEPPSSDVERALARVVDSARGSQADRRSAIGELADVLERDGFGELAPLARRIAWSSEGPSCEVASELALLVRAALEVAA
ncbi:MAG: hypothetical protein HOQ28_00835 [Thermoleophilia bacterium]|nr:hypothetical protein [Thermoleophilia bacterium]